MAFFRSGEKIEFPFWLGVGSGILGLSGTIMEPSMGPMPTSSQLTQPTLCKISSLSDSQFSGYIPLSRKHPNMQMSFSCENPHFSTDLVEICFVVCFLKKKFFDNFFLKKDFFFFKFFSHIIVKYYAQVYPMSPEYQ